MKKDLEQYRKIIGELIFLSKKDSLSVDEKKIIVKNFNQHFHCYRYAKTQWEKIIEEEFAKKDLSFSDYAHLYDLKIKIEERHFHSLKYISEKQVIPSLFFNFYQESSGLSFLSSYKSYLMMKHFQSCLFHSMRFLNFKYKNEELITYTNKHSISGYLFTNEGKDCFFNIPKNKASTFLFLDKGRIFGLDVSIDHFVDNEVMVPHFLLTHASFNEDVVKLKEYFVRNSKKEHYEIIHDVCDDRNIDNGKLAKLLKLNCNYLMCFENGTGNDLVSRESLSTIKTLGLESHQSHGAFFDNSFYSTIFNQLNYSGKIENQKLIDRDYTIEYLYNILSRGDYERFESSFDYIDQEYIQSAIIEKFILILRGIDEKRSSFKDFKKACFISGIEKEKLIDDTYLNIVIEKNYENFPYFIKENKFAKELRELLVRHILKSIIEDSKTNGDSPEEIIKNITPFSSVLKVRRIKNMLKKI